MNNVQTHTPRPEAAPDFPFKLARNIWIFTFAAVAMMHFAFWRPGQLLMMHDGPAPVWLAVFAAAVLGYGLAALIALVVGNWHKKRTVLWPKRGKFIGVFALLFVTPVAVISGIPWIFGGLTAVVAINAPSALMPVIAAIGTVLWYPISSVIICGTRSHKLRFGLFCVMFWSCYAAHILYSGLLTFRL